MKKEILLIGNPGNKAYGNLCEGVYLDLQNYKNFFMSKAGGEWNNDEIVTMISPDTNQVGKELIKMNRLMDYSIVVFSGHGYYLNGQTFIELRTTEDNAYDIPESKLRNSGRRLIILDCCRGMLSYPSIVEPLSESVISHSDIMPSTRDRYEELIQESEVNNVVLYSCGIAEKSRDRSDMGGLYSYSLLSQAYKDYDLMDQGYETALTVHNEAKRLVSLYSNDMQNPTEYISTVTSEKLAPFVIK